VSQKDWIFALRKIEFLVSLDGENVTTVYSEKIDILKKVSSKFQDLEVKISPQKTRFIKIVAEKIPSLPEWHAGKGQEAWIFLAEIMIK
jgi:hexosaminidase